MKKLIVTGTLAASYICFFCFEKKVLQRILNIMRGNTPNYIYYINYIKLIKLQLYLVILFQNNHYLSCF